MRFAAAVLTALVVAGCTGELGGPPPSEPPEFKPSQPSGAEQCEGVRAHTLDEIWPAYFDASAATGCSASGCHGTGAGGLRFRTAQEFFRENVGKPAVSRPDLMRIAPGDPAASFLYQKLLASAAGRMPQGGPYLDDTALQMVKGWICAGAPEPVAPDAGTPDAGEDAGIAGPVITSFSPTSGTAGTPVTITGTDFSATAAQDTVDFNGTPAAVTAATTTTLSTSVPTGASTGPLHVKVGGLTAKSATDFDVIVPNPVPALSSISPSNLSAGGADAMLTLTGTGFVSKSTAELDGTPLATTLESATALSAVIPAAQLASAGSHTITVVNPGPGGGTSGGKPLTVANPAPVIGSLTPSSVTVGAAALKLAVTGSGFLAATTVTLNGAPANATLVSGTSLSVDVPASMLTSAGTVKVVADNPTPGGGTSAAATLSVNNPAPVLTSVAPSSVSSGAGDVAVTLSGTGFLATSMVAIDGATLASTLSSGQLKVTVPSSITASGGAHLFTVTNPTPGGGTSAGKSFDVLNPAPALTSISPANVATGGAPFTLTATGSGFTGGSVVNFNGAPVATTFVDATTLTAQIPSISSAGTYAVTVTNPTPGGGTSAALNVTAATSTVPTITGVSPASAAENTAFTLTVTGSGYTCTAGGAKVLFNGATLTPSSCGATSLTASVPATAAGSYPVQVKNTNGQTSNTVLFNVVAPNPVPVLTSITPASGAVGGAGFTLTCDGSSFVSGAVVTWNGAARSTTFVSSTRVTASIPSSDLSAAGTATVKVANPAPGGGASNALSFTIAAPNPIPVISGVSPASLAEGSGAATLTVTGSSFVNGATATFNGSARTVTFSSPTQVQVALTAADTQTAGSYPLVVTNPAPGGGASNTWSVSVVANNPVPAISSLNPSSASTFGAAFTLTVNGTGFVSSSTVTFNGASRSTTYVSATQLKAAITSADLTTAGTYPVTVVNPAPGGGTSGAMNFSVTNPVPVLTSISPAAVTVGGAAFTLTANGSGFVNGSVVKLDGSARTTHFLTTAQLTADIPASDLASTGTHAVTVESPAPGGGASNTLTLTVASQPNPVPVVSTLTPCGAVAGSGAFTLTIDGTGFVNGATATFNGTAVTVTYVSSTRVTAAIPGTLVGSAPSGNSAPVVVTNPSPGGGSGAAVGFGVASKLSTLSGNVQRIFDLNCATSGCHNVSAQAGLDLSSGVSFANLVGVQSSGCAPAVRVKACAPSRSASVLLDKILASGTAPACSGSAMPKGAPLNSTDKQTIVDWVAQGAPK